MISFLELLCAGNASCLLTPLCIPSKNATLCRPILQLVSGRIRRAKEKQGKSLSNKIAKHRTSAAASANAALAIAKKE